MKWQALIPIAFLAAGAPAFGTPPDQIYTLNCWGCHQPHAQGIPGSVPRLANSMGYFLRIPEGRAYLAEVPGVAAAPLSDAEVAQVLNWMLLTFSRPQLPEHFITYTAGEIREYRTHKMENVTDTRQRLAAKLLSMGFKVAQDGEPAPSAAPGGKTPAPKQK
ncbi:MAG: c-type cytochrome [Candidatus Binataceae bacterium]